MNVDIKCFSSLVNPDSCDFKKSQTYRLSDGQTVGDLVEKAGIEKNDVKIAFVNSKIVDFDTILADGDRVGLAPAVGGM